MPKKITIGIVIVIFLFVTACGKSTKTLSNPEQAPINQTANSNQQKSVTDTNGSKAKVEEAFVDFQEGKPAKLSGNGNKEYKLTMTKGGFKLVIKTKDLQKGLNRLEIINAKSNMGIPVFTSAGAGKADSDWYVYERVEHINSSDEYILKVQAEGPYMIEIYKLPLASGNVALPLIIKGSGTRAIGPFAFNNPLTIKLKTANANEAGFSAKLIEASTAEKTKSVFANIDMKTKKAINNFDVRQEVTPTGSGSYFLLIEANSNCEWETEISN